jgi:hypothetical protein
VLKNAEFDADLESFEKLKKSLPKKVRSRTLLLRKALRSDRKGTSFEANAPTKDWKANLVRVSL